MCPRAASSYFSPQFRQRLEQEGHGAFENLETDGRSWANAIGAAGDFVSTLTRLRVANLYDDDEQGMLYDVLIFLRTVLDTAIGAASASTALQQLATSAHALVVDAAEMFHVDIRVQAAGLILLLKLKGALLPPVSMMAFAASFDSLLLNAGHFGLQNHLIWVLHAYRSQPDCGRKLQVAICLRPYPRAH